MKRSDEILIVVRIRLSLSFFENLLPEGAIRDAIERHQNISGVIEFLDKYGRDCAGAIVLSSHQESKNPYTMNTIAWSWQGPATTMEQSRLSRYGSPS
jgi:hypothetical protein